MPFDARSAPFFHILGAGSLPEVRMKGVLLVLEGPDGSGKSTQATRLTQRLGRLQRDCVHVREPGSTPLGERIRTWLLDSAAGLEIGPEAEMLLYMACRAQLFRSIIRPKLDRGGFVILERSYYSTYAYQGAGLGLDGEIILRLGHWACLGIRPDRVILLDVEVERGLARLQGTRDRIEGRDRAFHERVREGYLSLARRFPDLFRVVDGNGSVEEVEERIHAELRDLC